MSNIHEFKKPIACVTPLGDAYILYVTSNGFLENDEFTCVLMDGGQVKHFSSDMIRIWHNETYGIKKRK